MATPFGAPADSRLALLNHLFQQYVMAHALQTFMPPQHGPMPPVRQPRTANPFGLPVPPLGASATHGAGYQIGSGVGVRLTGGPSLTLVGQSGMPVSPAVAGTPPSINPVPVGQGRPVFAPPRPAGVGPGH